LSHITSAAYATEDQSNILPTISIKAQQDKNNDYVATQATSTLKSNAPLFKTAQICW
jgi:iron complex outermembrane receptor protein